MHAPDKRELDSLRRLRDSIIRRSQMLAGIESSIPKSVTDPRAYMLGAHQEMMRMLVHDAESTLGATPAPAALPGAHNPKWLLCSDCGRRRPEYAGDDRADPPDRHAARLR